MHALIVEDSRAMRSLLCRALVGLGFDVSQAGDARSALAYLDDGLAPDLVVVDHNLPGPDGLQLVGVLRTRPTAAGVKVLMISAEGHRAFITQALAAGVDDYLFKPFTPDALTSKIALLGLLTQPRVQPLPAW